MRYSPNKKYAKIYCFKRSERIYERPFAESLWEKPVYKASTEDEALLNLDKLQEKWGEKYPLPVNSWMNNWDNLATYFKYPQEIRTVIYTTNAVEAVHRQFRKVTKSKSLFPNSLSRFIGNDALKKCCS